MHTANPVSIRQMRERAESAACLLRTLANPHRLRVLCLQLEGDLNVGQINEQMPDLSQSALSQHLAKLRAEDLVTTRRDAQSIWRPNPGKECRQAD